MVNLKASRLDITNQLWRRGELKWKLDTLQQELYTLFHDGKHKTNTWLCSRRTGKSYALVVLALEQCIKFPNSIVKYAAPTKVQINTILRPIFKKILDDCPEDVKPILKSAEYIYYFPNGSEIQLAGTDSGHAEKLRGGDSHLAVIDEAGSCSDLNDLIKSILLPTTLTTSGKIIIAGTPPKEEDHDFISYIEQAELRGSLIKKTIHDNVRLTDKQREELILEVGGLHTEEARRELLCELIKSSSTSVVPEFNSDLEKEIVKDWPKPPFFDAYVSMDLGGTDLTAVLFAYYDFRADKIVVEDEIIMDFQEPGNNLEKLTKDIMDKEAKLWTNVLSGELKEPTLRVSDTNPIALNEITKYSNRKVNFTVTRKDDREAALNNFRALLNAKKVIIHPRCKAFIRHLKNCRWKSKTHRTEFARSADNGHYDAVDAGIYLIRNVNLRKNPYPSHYDLNLRRDDTFVYDKKKFNNSDTKEIFKKLFNVKSKGR